MYSVIESGSDKRFAVKYRQTGTKYEVFIARCLKLCIIGLPKTKEHVWTKYKDSFICKREVCTQNLK